MLRLGRQFLSKPAFSTFSQRFASSLAFVEQNGGAIVPGSLNAISAAKKVGGDLSLLVTGSSAKTLAESLTGIEGVSKVLIAENGSYDKNLPDNLATLIAETAKQQGVTHVFAAATSVGKGVMPRVSALLDVQQISDITSVESEDTFVRPIYAGNALATVQSTDPVKLVTVRGTAFEAAVPASGSAPIEAAADPNEPSLLTWESEEVVKSERPDLTSASRVVSGGRGLKSKENFEKLIFPLAESLNAAVGASRAAVDAGFADNSLQVGQTGKVVAPDLYLAVGISGAIQHLAGMKDSKVIAAVNKDEEAPIFQVADIGYVGDLFEVVPELTKKFSELK